MINPTKHFYFASFDFAGETHQNPKRGKIGKTLQFFRAKEREMASHSFH
jgi:hypothetical protein